METTIETTESKSQNEFAITVEQVLQLARDASLPVQEQSKFYKIARDRKALYVAKTEIVTRIDVSGFQMQHPAVTAPTKKNGRVTGHILPDLPQTASAIEEALERLLDGELGDKVGDDEFVISKSE